MVIEKDYGGFWDSDPKDLYVLASSNKPEEVKQAIKSKDIDKLRQMDRLGVSCHEVLHALTDSEKACGLKDYKNYAIGTAINEGMTQYLTEQMVPSTYKTYEKEVETTKYLLAILGEDMIDSYLNADLDSMLNLAPEGQARQSLMKITKLSDYRLNLSKQKNFSYEMNLLNGEESTREKIENIDTTIDNEMRILIEEIGHIDISNFIKVGLPIPDGVPEEVLQETMNDCLENEENMKYAARLFQNYKHKFR